jgi:hypothetical protein
MNTQNKADSLLRRIIRQMLPVPTLSGLDLEQVELDRYLQDPASRPSASRV